MEPGSRRPARAGIPLTEPPADIIVDDAGWRRLVPHASALTARALRAAGVSATVLLTSDARIKRLNARHRGRNQPTNVLTFPNGAGPGGALVLARGVVRREALAAARPAAKHLAHLVVHGALHLRGHDHMEAGDARRMELEEARILRRIGVANPWKGR